jgi:hypothetical protein
MNDNSNTNCVEVFRKVIDEFSYHSDKFANKPLPNITFFLGASLLFPFLNAKLIYSL